MGSLSQEKQVNCSVLSILCCRSCPLPVLDGKHICAFISVLVRVLQMLAHALAHPSPRIH